ncbi:DUF2190 family protein [Chitinophaga sp. sic0106]|uniref:DUF2190 family protein n=1 Tax=Chitinophaga sp. sic0106 TaxID=2854785 RepID=UPI001C481000|nr:DUF2190 family protein [Chitinophaga sp. sic0106]MBV7529030.1 DUF2190 family protein [Chitinophaga sp. sic0106]
MNTLVSKGNCIEVVAPSGGYSSGQPVLVGALVGISANKYAQNEIAVINLSGAFVVAKAAEAWNAGDKLYWDATNSVFTKTVGSNTFAGYAYSAALSAAGTGIILLRQ